MTTAEYAKQHGVSSETVRRWIREGKVHATQIQGVWDIPDVAHHTHATDTPHHEEGDAHIKALLAEKDARIAYLEGLLSEANDARARSDSIIMQISKTIEKQQLQIHDQTLKIEDLRQPLPFWQRLFQRRKLAESAT